MTGSAQAADAPLSTHEADSATAAEIDRVESCIDGGGLIAQTESGWLIQVGYERTEMPSDASADVVAGRLAELCDSVAGADRRCVLGLTTAECFFVDFGLPESIDSKDRGALAFELERHFPLDAEAMVSDYSVHSSPNRIAAVAIETARQRDIVVAIENAGIEVVSIIPTSFLIARAAQNWREEKTPFRLLLFGQTSVDSLLVEESGVCSWKQFTSTDDDLRRHQSVTADQTDSAQTLVVVGRNELGFKPTGPIQWCNQTSAQLVANGAAVVLRGRWGRWPDLRRGDLAPSDPLFAVAGPLRALALAATICFLVVSIAAWFRSSRLERQSELVRQQQRSEFNEAYPGRRVPVMLMRTVRSEHSKTLGSRGRGDAIKIPVPATTVLRDLFRGLQHAGSDGGARFRLIDVNVADGECSLTVRAKDSVQIGTIAKSLETTGFQVAPPASEQISPSKDEPMATYQSTISAVWIAKANESTKGDDS